MSLLANLLAFPLIGDVVRYWKPIFVISVPFIALPLALNGHTDSNGDDITKVTYIIPYKSRNFGQNLGKILSNRLVLG